MGVPISSENYIVTIINYITIDNVNTIALTHYTMIDF